MDEVETEIFNISADMDLAAISKEAFVLVEFSKNKFITKQSFKISFFLFLF